MIRTRPPALAHATLDDITDTELLGDLLHVDGLVAQPNERRVARDDEEPAQLSSNAVDDVLADAVGIIFLLRIAGHVGEGKHGYGGAIGKRQGRPQRLVNFIGWRTACVCRLGED